MVCGETSNDLKNRMVDTMWDFLQMGGMKPDWATFKGACMDLRHMMMQKTAGQRKDKRKDISFENLERIEATIIIEAMALVLSGEFDELGEALDLKMQALEEKENAQTPVDVEAVKSQSEAGDALNGD